MSRIVPFLRWTEWVICLLNVTSRPSLWWDLQVWKELSRVYCLSFGWFFYEKSADLNIKSWRPHLAAGNISQLTKCGSLFQLRFPTVGHSPIKFDAFHAIFIFISLMTDRYWKIYYLPSARYHCQVEYYLFCHYSSRSEFRAIFLRDFWRISCFWIVFNIFLPPCCFDFWIVISTILRNYVGFCSSSIDVQQFEFVSRK